MLNTISVAISAPLTIDHDGLALARPSLNVTFDGNYGLKWNPSASSVFTEGRLGTHERIDRI